MGRERRVGRCTDGDWRDPRGEDPSDDSDGAPRKGLVDRDDAIRRRRFTALTIDSFFFCLFSRGVRYMKGGARNGIWKCNI